MILSYDLGCVFVKTHKTAGTSVELYLSDHAGESAVVTPVYPAEAGHRPRNHRRLATGDAVRELRRAASRGPRAGVRRLGSLAFPRTDPFFNHMAARQVRAILGEDRWRSYFTFCFERDPWDKVISWYHFEAGRSPTPLPPFASWLAREGSRLSDWSLYADDDGPIVDFVGQFSRLEQDLGVVAERLGLPAFTRLPHSKPRRPRTSGPAVTHDGFTVELVSRVFEREIAHFGYRPPAI